MKRSGRLKSSRRTDWRNPSQQRAYQDAQRKVYQRCGGACEVNWDGRCELLGTQAHHIWKSKRGRGGPDTEENLLWVCTPCHIGGIHAHEPEAIERGFLARNAEELEASLDLRGDPAEFQW